MDSKVNEDLASEENGDNNSSYSGDSEEREAKKEAEDLSSKEEFDKVLTEVVDPKSESLKVIENIVKRTHHVSYSSLLDSANRGEENPLIKKCPICRDVQDVKLNKLPINFTLLDIIISREHRNCSFVYCVQCLKLVYSKSKGGLVDSKEPTLSTLILKTCLNKHHVLYTNTQIGDIKRTIETWSREHRNCSFVYCVQCLKLVFSKNAGSPVNTKEPTLSTHILKTCLNKHHVLYTNTQIGDIKRTIETWNKEYSEMSKKTDIGLERILKAKDSEEIINEAEAKSVSVLLEDKLKERMSSAIESIAMLVSIHESNMEGTNKGFDPIQVLLFRKKLRKLHELKYSIKHTLAYNLSYFRPFFNQKDGYIVSNSLKASNDNNSSERVSPSFDDYSLHCISNIHTTPNQTSDILKSSFYDSLKYNLLDYKSFEKRFTASFEEGNNHVAVYDLKLDKVYFHYIKDIEGGKTKKQSVLFNESLSIEVDYKGEFLYIIGGKFGELEYEEFFASSKIIRYDLQSGKTTTFSKLKQSRHSPTVVSLPYINPQDNSTSHKILVIGGVDINGEPIRKCEFINLEDMTVLQGPSLNEDLRDCSACVLSNKVYLVGAEESGEMQVRVFDYVKYLNELDSNISKSEEAKWMDVRVRIEYYFKNCLIAPLSSKELIIFGGIVDDDQQDNEEEEVEYNEIVYKIDIVNNEARMEHNYISTLYQKSKEKEKKKGKKDTKKSKGSEAEEDKDKFSYDLDMENYTEGLVKKKVQHNKMLFGSFRFSPAIYKYKIACIDVFNEKFDNHVLYNYNILDESFTVKEIESPKITLEKV
eukprot:CAMPEP_0170536560 /NCGR_PEP_ID=MMETSP0209-20121228/102210_1 /TAXON_ID=665100 ORGANISM="Litonotus pictus, Strain P1" /NCGR_SAMPLE_ID=MMETSP0209 /ASSEMBLY_ACC=CAM_ASM_000301 /LENGTH=814 /DNA_ID=CAMNT_0010837933 /DNA_START=167 /DNA_END=2611 /DNA_ORIENTATION=+